MLIVMKTRNKFLIAPLLLLLTNPPSAVFGEDEQQHEYTQEQCAPPQTAPAVPDGRRSSEEEMKEAMTEIRDYLSANAAFRECAGAVLKKGTDSLPENTKAVIKRTIEESVETDELLADLFNQQVRIFKAANPED